MLETYEAGIALVGTEVKSIRNGNVNLKDSWCSIDDGQLLLRDMHVSPYEKGNVFNKDPRRVRQLLMHKREIVRLKSSIERDGYTLVPLSLYFLGDKVKVELGVCKGKKLYDKHEAEAQKAERRDIERFEKERNR